MLTFFLDDEYIFILYFNKQILNQQLFIFKLSFSFSNHFQINDIAFRRLRSL